MSDKEKGYNHILKYTSLFGGVQGLTILIGLVRNKFMALFLGAGGMGLNVLLMSMQNFASQCTGLGISYCAVPCLSDLYERGEEEKLIFHIKVVRTWSAIAALLGLVFCILVSPLVNAWTFTWGDHTLHYAFIGFAVAMSTITGSELAILKAKRQLGTIARIQIASALLGVLFTVPLYFFFGQRGVAPAIVLLAFATMIVTVTCSYRCQSLQLLFSRLCLKEGLGMIKFGVTFVMAAAVGSGAEMIVRSYLNMQGGLDNVGFYNAGYMIAITYAGMVFSAMETDYFPRLSGVAADIKATNETVNKQMEVSLLILSPMLVALMMFLPILVPLLFSHEFIPVIAMAQVAVFAMFFKVMTLPVAYITLARRRSKAYFFLETAYFVVLVIAVAIGFRLAGVFGAGVGIVMAHLFDFLMINTFAYFRYAYRCTWPLVRYALVQFAIVCVAYWVTCNTECVTYWMIEAALTFVSTAYSVTLLYRKTHLWQALTRRFLGKNR